MGEQELKTILVERDIDQDRFLSYDHFKLLLKEFEPLSKYQIYFMLLGVLGWRPIELCRMRLEDIDPIERKIRWNLAKPRLYYKGGEDYVIKKQKVKWRFVPSWAFDLLNAYIKRNIHTMVDGYIFTAGNGNHYKSHMHVGTIQIVLKEKRDELYARDPIKWGWVKDVYMTITYGPSSRHPCGGKQDYYKLSCYAFRKMHATYYAQMLLDRGVSDVLLLTAQHMGHTKPSTTYTYVKQLLDEKPLMNNFKDAVNFIEFATSRPKISKDQRKIIDF